MRVLPLLFATAIVLLTTTAVLVTSLPTEEVINLVREARKHVPAGASAELTAQALSSVATRSQMVTTSIVGDSFKSGFAGAMDTIAEKAGRGAGKGGELMTELFPDKELRIAFKASKGPEPVAFLARLGLRSGAITEVKASTIDDLVYLYRTRLDAGLKLSDQEKLLLTDLLEMQRDGQLIAKDGKYIVKESAVKLPLKAGTFARQAQVLKISAEQLEEGALRVLNRRRSVAKSEVEFWEQKIAELKKMSSMQRGSRGDAKIAYFESQANAARAQLEKLQLPTASTSIRNEIMLVQKRPLVNPTPSPADIAAASRLLQNEIDSVTATITKRRLALQETKIANFANAEKRSVTANLELQKADLATVEKIAELEARLAELQTISGPQYALLIAAGTR